jgi:ATP-dependent helicase/nuclease subunit A
LASSTHVTPPDQDQRDIIRHELDTTLLVEAAAGTGKTTGMVGRMVNLLAEGKCSVDMLAAVTFTRKAAAELRARFQIELEKSHRDAGPSSKGLLRSALDNVERCFIGTIHSFCARMLRERPVEAGVDLDFQEVDDVEDHAIRNQAWAVHVNGLYASRAPILDELEELGVEIGQLGYTFAQIADYLDVDEWPATPIPPPDLASAMPAIEEQVRHMGSLAGSLPESPGNDQLIPKYRLIPLMYRQVRRKDRAFEIMEILAQFKEVRTVKKMWPQKAKQADAELAQWDEFRLTVAEPLVRHWREHRYEPLLRAMLPALDVYEKLRNDAGKLNYQDLLIKSARLLREGSASGVRDYFRRRFTHILVDEFQDTDPVQAEVIMLLTAENSDEVNWRKCRPVPGSLFVVGDPKQSIYRFRRADIVTYNQVKDIIRQHGGKVVTLTANFRTTSPIVTWVNETFEHEFQLHSADCSPDYVPLTAVREDDGQRPLTRVGTIRVPKDCKNNEQICEYEGGLIARTIRNALDTGLTIPRTNSEIEAGVSAEAQPGDFLIVTPKTGNLHAYSRKLQELGISHQVTGGTSLNQVTELRMLHKLLEAITQPENSIALVAVLRGDLFGISDPDLFAFKRSNGQFCYHATIPESLDTRISDQFADAFSRLQQYDRWLNRFPPVSAVEKISTDLGLPARAAMSPGGDVRAGSLAKALELLRSAQREFWSKTDLTAYLGRLVAEDEAHDAIAAKPHDSSVVRVMNLHKVKGLEAPVVFLADPTGKTKHPAELYVDRAADKVRGFVAIRGSVTGSGRPVLLAQPPYWEQYSGREEEFQNAEELRLLYVAATRAGCGLTVTLRESYRNRNPWDFFHRYLKRSQLLEDPGPQLRVSAEASNLTESEVANADSQIQERWMKASAQTYHVAAVKAMSVQRGKFSYSTGEHGTEWGEVIHLLLETAMLEPGADIRALAEAAIVDKDLDSSLCDEALKTVDSVIRSDFWKRAQRSERTLVEVPLQRLIPGTGDPGSVQTILRGVIDLVFKEPDGWVIVDYKSDRVAEDRLDGLVEHYSPQVLGYADAWREIVGEPVYEVGLYFTHARRYVTISNDKGRRISGT